MKCRAIGGGLALAILLSGCVSKSEYDALAAQNQQLQQQIVRLQSAIKYTVNSDLLFPSGGWQISAAGKDIIAKLAAKLAPSQRAKLIVSGYTDNAPIGPGLVKQGITTNQMLSEKRAENVMQFLISQGVSPSLIASQGFGEGNPVASNDTPKGRAENRRVELSLAPS